MKVSSFKRITAMLLALALMCGMVLTGTVLPAAAEETTDWDYAHTMAEPYEYWTVAHHFAHYEFAKPAATASAIASRSVDNANTRDWAYTASARDYWSTGYYGAHNNGLLKATNHGGEWDVLTYKVEDMKDFQVQFTIPDAYARQGIMFGADKGVIPATGDGDYDNDTGVIIAYENMNWKVGGAIAESTGTYGDLPNMKVATATVTARTFSMALNASVSETTLHTYNVKVENGVLSIWAEGEEDLKKEIALSENYKGGYVSFFSASNQCGLYSFKIKKLSDAERPEWDYAHEMAAKKEAWALDAHFKAYEFTRYAKNTSATFIGGPYLTTEKIAYSETVSKARWLTEEWGSYNKGWLKPMRSTDMQVLTYTTKQFENFELEFSLAASYEAQGIIFGAALDDHGVTLDGDNTNDTGVYVRLESSTNLVFAGAIDPASWDGSTTYSEFTGTAIANARVSEANANAVTGNAEVNTFRIKVEGKKVTVWDVDEPDLAKTFNLSDNYEGGYISYFANGCSQNGLVSFKVREIDEDDIWDYEHTMSATYEAWALADDFNAYNFSKPSTTAQVIPTRGPVNPDANDADYTSTRAYWATSYYGSHNNGILKYTAYGSDWGMLTYKVDKMKDFKLEFTIPDSYARQGIIFGGDLGVMPVSGDSDVTNDTGVILAYENMQFFAGGALKEDTNNHGDLPNMNVAKLTVTEREFNMGLNAAASAQTLHTYHVKVEDGVLTMWSEGEEALAQSVELSDNYTGGYVSFFSASNQCGLWSLKIEKLSDAEGHEWDYAHTMTAKNEAWPLDAHFRAVQFAIPSADSATAATWGPVAPSTERAYSETVNKKAWLTEDWGSYNKGWLKAMKSGEGYQVLTYNVKEYESFEVEFTVSASYSKQGIIFGSALDELGVTLDGDNTNDTAVIARIESAKQIAFAGAVNPDRHWDGGKTYGDFPNTAVVNATVSENNANAVTSNTEMNTFRIKVEGQKVTVWDVDEPELAKTFYLSENYEGGYVSYFMDGPSQTSMQSFKIKGLETPEHECDYYIGNYDENGHWNECECGETTEVVAHVYDNDCDASCDCGYTREVGDHDYATTQYDENGHWTVCACGDTTEVVAHAYDNDCDASCDCGYTREVGDHNYATPNYDENGHWNECECGEKDTVVAHAYDNDCDATCDCGYTREVGDHDYATTQYDENGHWTVCACGDTTDVIAHAYDNDCDATCDCGYTREVGDHAYTYVVDGDQHYQVCGECGHETEKAPHDFSEGDCVCGTEKPQEDDSAVVEGRIITVKAGEGSELKAGSLLVKDANGDYFVPQRVGYRNSGDASRFEIPEGAVAPYTIEYEFIRPSGNVDPMDNGVNMACVGLQTNPTKGGLRFIHRLNVSEDADGKLYINYNGEKQEVEEYGLLLASSTVLTGDANRLTLEKALESFHIKEYAWPAKGIYYDKCSDYVDIAVQVTGIVEAGGADVNIISRTYVKLADGQVYYGAVTVDNYNAVDAR